jgi:hypothetical protein
VFAFYKVGLLYLRAVRLRVFISGQIISYKDNILSLTHVDELYAYMRGFVVEAKTGHVMSQTCLMLTLQRIPSHNLIHSLVQEECQEIPGPRLEDLIAKLEASPACENALLTVSQSIFPRRDRLVRL